MECNKDEAIRAKEIAEKKLAKKDIPGARKFASKAQSLFPGLEGLSQFLEVLDVYAASERKVNGEVDFYEVLGVDPLADDETLRKNYKKLARALHPDKNKAVGADGAFKILSEAWSLLCDKIKRAAYNKKRNIGASYEKVAGKNPPVGVKKNSNHNFTNNRSSSARKPSPPNSQTDSIPHKPNANTFWTSCKRCMMQYEYMAIYKNQNLLCPNCRQPFLATEMPPPVKRQPVSSPWVLPQKQQGDYPASNASTDSGRKFGPTPKMRTPGFSGVGSMGRANVPQEKCGGPRSMSASVKNPTQPAYSFQPSSENIKRRHEETVGIANEEALREKVNASKKRRINEHMVNIGLKDMVHQMPSGNGVDGRSNFSGNQTGRFGTEKVNVSGSIKPRILRELSESDARSMLMEKAKMEIRKKLLVWNMAAPVKSSGKAGKEMEQKPTSLNASQEFVVHDMEARNINALTEDNNFSVQHDKSLLPSVNTSSNPIASRFTYVSVADPGLKGCSLSSKTTGSNIKATEIMTMAVPDPEFYDFDKDRIEDSFAENQIWAAYDNEDGMPRYYAIIREVLSKTPFKVRFSWLNSKRNNELGPLNRVGCGFSQTCGDFKIGKSEVSMTLNTFSHRVKWTKGAKGIIQIFPKKGDVWALYRNWSSEWNELTPDDVMQQYDVVEVLQEYNEEEGVSVAPLVKVAGFKSVFHQHLDRRKMYIIPREEMFRFSHQVASYIITGQESVTAPKGCRELDTAAMPLELLQVIKEDEGEGGSTAEELSAVGDADATMSSGGDNHDLVEQHSNVLEENLEKKVVGNTINDNEETR